MRDGVSIAAAEEAKEPEPIAGPQQAVLRQGTADDPARRRRMGRQARLMGLAVFLMLMLTFSVPFILRALAIAIP